MDNFRPWLIQRAAFRSTVKGPVRVSEQYDLDYMGAAEFEWGALPKALRMYGEILPKLKKNFVECKAATFYFLSIPAQADEAAKWIVDRATDGSARCRLKEPIELETWAKGKSDHCWETYPPRHDLYFDLDHPFVISPSESVLDSWIPSIQESIKYMNSEKAKKEKEETDKANSDYLKNLVK